MGEGAETQSKTLGRAQGTPPHGPHGRGREMTVGARGVEDTLRACPTESAKPDC